LHFEKDSRVGVGYLGQNALEISKAGWGEEYVTYMLVVLLSSYARHAVDP